MSTFYKGYKGNRNSTNDNNLNLVPFIDLFSTMIIFLLVTAVFDDLAGVPVALGDKNAKSPEITQSDSAKPISSSVKIIVSKKQITMIDGGRSKSFDIIPDQEDYTQLEAFLENVRIAYPNKKDILITTMDNAYYEHLVAVLDNCLGNQFDELVVSGGG